MLVDQQRIKRAFNRAADHYDTVAIVQNEVAQRLCGRLDFIKLNPQHILDLGCGTGNCAKLLQQRYITANVFGVDFAEKMLQQAYRKMDSLHVIQANAEHLPLTNQSINLIVANCLLPWTADLTNVLQECWRVLAPGGLLLFSTFGPDTLIELRHSFATLDQQHGHINHFLDMHDVGDQLLQVGWMDPVMDAEHFTMTYQHLDQLMRELKMMGSIYFGPQQQTHLRNPAFYKSLSNVYEAYRHMDTKLLPVSVEIIYGHAWKSTQPVKQQTQDGYEINIDIKKILRR